MRKGSTECLCTQRKRSRTLLQDNPSHNTAGNEHKEPKRNDTRIAVTLDGSTSISHVA